MTTPAVEGLLTQPYVSVPEFRAAPTWIDSEDLIPGGSSGQQDSELTNVLLRASAWADNYCEQRLGAHTVVEQTRVRPDHDGLFYLSPSNVPVRQVTAIAYGSTPQRLTALSDLSGTWVEDARGIVVSTYPNNPRFNSLLQFGPAMRSEAQMYVQYSYIAGYANTVLTQPVKVGQHALSVSDPTGFIPPSTGLVGPIQGSTARIWEPGAEEAVQVATGWTVGNPTIALATPLVNAHNTGAVVSEMPAEIRQAIICHAVALLIREDVTAEEPWAGTPFGPTARRSEKGGKAGGLVDHAMMLLEPFRRVR